MKTHLTPVRVLIVDDLPQVRQGLQTALALFDGIELVGEAANGVEAVEQVKLLHPDVVLLDLEMPVMDGYEAARQIKACWPDCRVVALTIHDGPAERKAVCQAGADAFIAKGAPLRDLVGGILG